MQKAYHAIKSNIDYAFSLINNKATVGFSSTHKEYVQSYTLKSYSVSLYTGTKYYIILRGIYFTH